MGRGPGHQGQGPPAQGVSDARRRFITLHSEITRNGGRALPPAKTRDPPRGPAFEPSQFDDLGFLAKLRERDQAAIGSVVQAYLGQVVRAARGAGFDAARAEDIAQATFLTFIETAHRFEGRSKLRTWLFGILFRKVSEARRTRRRDDEWDDLETTFESRFDERGSWVQPPRPPDKALEDAEVRTAVGECLDLAPTPQRMAFALREIEGLSTGEICKILEVTATNLGVMLHRVRNRLRACLEARGIYR